MKTLIQGGFVVGFNGREHEIFKDGVVVIDGERILFVGKDYPERTDKQINARGCLISPGFIGTHFHSGDNTGDYFLTGPDKLDYFAGNYLAYVAPLKTSKQSHAKDIDVGQRFSFIHILKSGVTTAIEMGGTGTEPDRYVDMLAEVGIRCYTGPSYRSADYVHDSEGRIEYDWNDQRGFERFKQAISFAKKFNGAARGRINAMLFPGHVDTCSPDLFEETKRVAKDLGLRTQTHCGINLIEFNTCMQKYRCTPVEFLHRLGFLGPEVSLSHCVFVSGHSWTAYPYGDDLKRIADSGASVAHDPLKYMKLGTAIESFDRYLRAGINVTLETDTFPQDIISEMRYAALASRMIERSFVAGQPRDIFNAATLGGAQLLGREDLGRLAKGAKADVVIVDLRNIIFGAVRDPIKALVESATSSNVRTVIVDGEVLVDHGKYLRLDEEALLEKLQRNADASWARVSDWHWTGKPIDQIVPPAFGIRS
jgi:cytosine/adenosine deaminase-related metal-dependent hydrolase